MQSYAHTQFQELLAAFPLPIAHEYQELLRIEAGSWFELNMQLQQVSEFTIRYCAAIMLSEYRRSEQPSGETADFILKRLTDRQVIACVQIMRRVAQAMRREADTFVPELQAFCRAPEGAVAEGLMQMERLANMGTLASKTSPSELRLHQKFFQDAIAELHDLLMRLQFLVSYRLIRLEEPAPDGAAGWSVTEYMGAEVRPEYRYVLPVTGPVEPRTLGLWAGSRGSFMPLTPYSLFQFCDQCARQAMYGDDFFLFERSDAGRSIYVGLKNTNGDPHRISLDAFIDQQLARYQRARQRGEMTWAGLLDQMRAQTFDEIQRLEEKYDPAVFTRREALEASLLAFLDAPYTGFLIVGDSGVGKTNQLCHLAGLAQQRGGIAILANCAAWESEATTGPQGLDGYLAQRYSLEEVGTWSKVIYQLHTAKPTHQPLVLFLDAINEYFDPRALLDSLQQLLERLQRYPWFKVVVSCRSESWRRLEGSFRTEQLFQPAQSGVVHRLERFGPDELELAYGKYQSRYQLKTNFANLSDQVKRFVAFPLMLRLVAESNQGLVVPEAVRSQVVFKKYVELKIGSSDRALTDQSERERLIIHRLLTLMIEQKRDNLDKARLFDDPRIGQLVLDSTWRSAYMRLLDKGVLLEVGHQATTVVRFTYDQILEYLLAVRLLGDEIELARVVKLIQEATLFPSLWGAVKGALLMRQAEDRPFAQDALLLDLIYKDDYLDADGGRDQVTQTLVRGLLIDVLVTWAAEATVGKPQVRALASEVLGAHHEGAGLLAVEVAHRLVLTDILLLGAYSRVPYVRQFATQYIFFLFQHGDGRHGVELYQRLQHKVRQQLRLLPLAAVAGRGLLRRLVPSRRTAESIQGLGALLDLSLLAIPLGYRYPDVVRPVGQMLGQVLTLLPRPLKLAINVLLLPPAIERISRMMQTGIQLKGMRSFTARPLTDPFRKKVARLMDHFDANVGSLDAELGDLVFDVAGEIDTFGYLMIVQVLMTRVGPRLDSLYRFCRRLYQDDNVHRKHIALRVFTLVNHIEHGSKYWQPAYGSFARTMILEMAHVSVRYPLRMERGSPQVTYSGATREELAQESDLRKRMLWFMRSLYELHDGLAHLNYGLLDELASRHSGALDLVEEVRALPWPHPEFLRTQLIMAGLTGATMAGVATTRLNILPILETCQLYFGVTDPEEQEAVAMALVYIRSFFPSYVDDYLVDAPRWLRLKVLGDFQPLSLAPIGTTGMQWGIPWMFLTTPAFRDAAAAAMQRAALHSQDIDASIPALARAIVSFPMLDALAQALATVGSEHHPE